MKKRNFKKVLITGGAGFIGSHLVKQINSSRDWKVSVLDSITYAGDLKNLKDTEMENFYRYDIKHLDTLKKLSSENTFDAIIHLAAESHVDRSIENPLEFVETNVNGTVNLLEIGLQQFKKNPKFVFYHVSTDEVFGDIPLELDYKFDESTSYDPSSPYSASKAASDHFVRAYHRTYGLPVVISNCSNNYGTHQYPEKLIPVVVNRLLNGEKIPVYGSGENMRDWLHVRDHADAIINILERGTIGETYCVGGNTVISNLELVKKICSKFDQVAGEKNSERLISFVEDRKGHDLKYAINASKLEKDLDWKPRVSFDLGLKETVQWYVDQKKEIKNILIENEL
jgi:dTDP-glucose 4,6-dehydratase